MTAGQRRRRAAAMVWRIVVGVVRDGRLLLDFRTLTDREANAVAAAIAAARV